MHLSVRIYRLRPSTVHNLARRRARLIIVVDEVDGDAPPTRNPTVSKIVDTMCEDVDNESISSGSKKDSNNTWVKIIKLILECVLATLTGLGVASCSMLAGL